MVVPRPGSDASTPSAWSEWLAQRPAWLLTLIVLVALAPFLTKPFNIDDPLFIWIARHIQSHPADPYGFSINWYGYDSPVWAVTKNPPLACYYLSLAGSVLGWSETALHGAFLLPAVMAIVGSWRVARRLCRKPVHAAVLTLFTPVFLVSATTLMCDVLMLAFWVWALEFWFQGAERKSAGRIGVAACLIALAALTKYFGACLIPLVVLWSIVRKQAVKEWLGWLALPVLALIGYQLATRGLYGRGLLADAAGYANVARESLGISNVRSLVCGLAFTGACLAPIAFYLPLIWRGRTLAMGAAASLIVAGALCYVARNSFPTPLTPLEIVQVLFWSVGGTGVLALAVSDCYRKRDADSLLLGCWVGGTFIFAVFCNWAINGRSILPMTIPASILVVRRMEERRPEWSRIALIAPAAAGAVLAVWVAVADYFFAQAPQMAARAVCANYVSSGHRLWFQGHWGFQYYMEQGGATALDLQHFHVAQGDYIAMPNRNTNVQPLKNPVSEAATITVPVGGGGMSTMYKPAGSGFYASIIGPLPFALGPEPEQEVKVFTCDAAVQLPITNAAASADGNAGMR